MRQLIVLVAALVVAVIAGSITYQNIEVDPARAVATVRLDHEEVRWPYHDATIAAQGALAEDDDFVAEVARAAAVDASDVTLRTTTPTNQTIFEVVAHAASPDDAIRTADAAVTLMIERNLAELGAGLEATLTSERELLAQLSAELETTRQRLDTEDLAESERVVATAEVGVLAGAAKSAEVAIDEAQEELDRLRPQLLATAPATVDDNTDTRRTSAGAAALGSALIVLAAGAFFLDRRTS